MNAERDADPTDAVRHQDDHRRDHQGHHQDDRHQDHRGHHQDAGHQNHPDEDLRSHRDAGRRDHQGHHQDAGHQNHLGVGRLRRIHRDADQSGADHQEGAAPDGRTDRRDATAGAEPDDPTG